VGDGSNARLEIAAATPASLYQSRLLIGIMRTYSRSSHHANSTLTGQSNQDVVLLSIYNVAYQIIIAVYIPTQATLSTA
jgi:hypothetical protein